MAQAEVFRFLDGLTYRFVRNYDPRYGVFRAHRACHNSGEVVRQDFSYATRGVYWDFTGEWRAWFDRRSAS